IIDSEKITVLARDLEKGGVWSFSDSPRWEESFLWKSSSSRPIHRNHEEQAGVGQWFVGDSGTQSPGLMEPAVPSSKSRSEKSRKRK
ncbi:MAG: hypothetical protein LLF89_04625, partial [Spirochaetaceae bacterium]|nr:hypothetical protein [Spirochaetaceae bacterium]